MHLQILQIVGAPIGAYLVTHLEPHKTQLCIAIALTVVFFLMAFPPGEVRRLLGRKWRTCTCHGVAALRLMLRQIVQGSTTRAWISSKRA